MLLTFSSGAGNSIGIADPDVGSGNLNVQLKATHGTVKLNGIVGLTVTGDGTSDVTVTGAICPHGDQHGPERPGVHAEANYSGQAQIQIITNDQQTGITDGPRSDDDTLTITVVADDSRSSTRSARSPQMKTARRA